MGAFVDLRRRFTEFSPEQDPERLAESSYLAAFMGKEGGISWDELLQHRLVIVLGEPGSGKTTELKHQVERLRDKGSIAYFLPLDRLVAEEIPAILETGLRAEFLSWQQGQADATFFLDAVDESKLRRTDDFLCALDRIASVTASRLSRCRFVISSRISSWRPWTDRDEVVRRFGYGQRSQQGDTSAPILVVSLLPLSSSRVESFATQQGVRDPAAFVAAIEDHDAWDFARRPLDVVDLYKYWNANGRLDSLSRLLEFSVANLLAEVERRAGQDHLPSAEAQEGAELLAAATILSRQVSISIQDDNAVDGPEAFSPKDVLPLSWLPSKTRALLDRAMFDGASYGCLRFHHRRHAEYLAAQWIERLMGGNCPFDALEEVLFARVDGQPVLRPSLEPVAAWLIKDGNEPWRQRLASKLLQTAPDIHFRWGDPAALPPSYRREILASVVRRFAGRRLVHLPWHREALTRIATPELVDDLNRYLRDKSISEALREDFLMVARYGKLEGTVPVALEILSDENTSDSLKTYAASVVRDVGTIEHRKQAAALIPRLKNPSNGLIGSLIEAIFPQAMAAPELLALLPQCREVPRYSVDLPHTLEPLFESRLAPEMARKMLSGLLGYLGEPPLIEGKYVSQRYAWLLRILPVCLRKLMSANRLDVEDIGLAIESIELLERCGRHGLWDDPARDAEERSIQAAAERHPPLKQALFWKRVATCQEKYPRQPVHFHFLQYGALVPLSWGDLDWLVNDMNGCRSTVDRRLAMDMVLSLFSAQGRPSRHKYAQLVRDVLGSTVLLPHGAAIAWNRILAPARRFWHYQRYRGVGDRYWWRQRYWRVDEAYRDLRSRLWLWRHRKELRRGEHPWVLGDMAHQAGTKSSSQLSADDWSNIEAKWGRLVRDAVQTGCEAVWRNFEPPFPHEKAERNSYDLRIAAGLSGLQSLWRKGFLDFAALSAKDVACAVRYACNELNGFPEWFAPLLSARPLDVCEVLCSAVAGEWKYSAEMLHVGDVVSTLSWHDRDMRLAGQVVLDQLQLGDPVHPAILDYAFRLLLKNPEMHGPALVTLAPQRLAGYAIGSRQWFAWMDVWFQLEAMSAINYLESVIAATPAKEADELVINLCSRLSGRRSSGIDGSHRSFLAPECLLRLIPVVARHVRVAEDNDRAGGGVYSPNFRDDAQQFRSQLWEWLGNSEEPYADEALRTLLLHPEMADRRDWILHLLDGRRSRRAEGAPWLPSDIRVFADRHLIAPRSDYKLFRLVCGYLRDFGNEIEYSENASNRLQLRPSDREENFRGLLFSVLEQKGGDWFSVTQESEVDFGQRPDLTVKRSGLNSLPIEIKLANLRHWTLPKLLERLENQLVGQYLRPAHVRHGIYVLGNTDAGRIWVDPATREKLDFDALVRRVAQRAEQLQNEMRDGVDAIAVLGIDFSGRAKQP